MVYLCLPKVFEIEAEVKECVKIRLKFKFLIFYIKTFSYKFPNRSKYKEVPIVKKKGNAVLKIYGSFSKYFYRFPV